MKGFTLIILCTLLFINACSGGGTSSRVVTIADVGGNPDGITVTDSGNIYITDIADGEIIQITPEGEVAVVADLDSTLNNTHPDGITSVTDTATGDEIIYITATGSGDPEDHTASIDGTIQKIVVDPVTGAGAPTVFVDDTVVDNPTGIAVDADGNLYVADQSGAILKIPVDGSGNPGTAVDLTAGVVIEEPHGLTLVTNSDNSITLYTTDQGSGSNNIVRIDLVSASDSNVNAITEVTPDSTGGTTAGTTANAEFNKPHGISTDRNGAIFIADEDNNRIQIITPGGNVVTFAGNGTAGDTDGDPDTAQFNNPRGMAVDKNGDVLVCDYGNGKVKKIIK